MQNAQRPGHAWVTIVKACLLLALASLLFNVALQPEIRGHWQTYSFVRKTLTQVVNSGTAWAGIAIFAGWKLFRWWESFAGGIAAAFMALIFHYASGMLLAHVTAGFLLVSGSDDLLGNLGWFRFSLIACGPLGFVGWVAQRQDWRGIAARLVVPTGAVLEPFLLGNFTAQPEILDWSDRFSPCASGVFLVLLGIGGYVLVIRSATRPAQPRSATPDRSGYLGTPARDTP